ncbi:MAG: hypothetical protein R3B47_19950 [Bacteroidia bacterium]
MKLIERGDFVLAEGESRLGYVDSQASIGASFTAISHLNISDYRILGKNRLLFATDDWNENV